MEELKQIIQNQNGMSRTNLSFDDMTPRDYAQMRADSMNSTPGNRHEQDGYNCPVCMNRGGFMKIVDANNTFYDMWEPCKCIPIRTSILRMKRSGLKDVIHDCTFDKWIASEDWQKGMKNAAMEYAESPKGWFYIGGQSGCGKTHLCTAICRELLLNGKEVIYMQWREDAVKLKGMTNKEPEQRQQVIDSFKNAEVLYIDDLFKCGKNPDGSEQKPTSADINIAFEILNYRYNNPESLTIISSELSSDELLDIDEATGSRVCERSKVIKISKNKSRNYRIKNQITF